MNHILKLSHKHICFLQETQWSSVQYNHLLLQSPFCTITHAPAINTSSSGVAILLPKTLTPSASSIIAPGYILSVSISVGGITVELINVYLHLEHVPKLCSNTYELILVVPTLSVSSAVTLTNCIPNLFFRTFSRSLTLLLHPLCQPFVNQMAITAHLTFSSFNSLLVPTP